MNTTPTTDAEYRLLGDVLDVQLDPTQTVLLSLPENRYYSLNESAACMWERLRQGATVTQLAGALEAVYEVSHEEALDHVRAFLPDLLREGLIHASPAEG